LEDLLFGSDDGMNRGGRRSAILQQGVQCRRLLGIGQFGLPRHQCRDGTGTGRGGGAGRCGSGGNGFGREVRGVTVVDQRQRQA
jgi:hypothetical protein